MTVLSKEELKNAVSIGCNSVYIGLDEEPIMVMAYPEYRRMIHTLSYGEAIHTLYNGSIDDINKSYFPKDTDKKLEMKYLNTGSVVIDSLACAYPHTDLAVESYRGVVSSNSIWRKRYFVW